MIRILTLLLIAGVLVHCTRKSGTDYGLDPKETLRINLGTEPPELDWTKANDTTSGTVIVNIMEGLMAVDLHDPNLTPVPRLATDVTASPDGLHWTITLRQDVKWTDGVALLPRQFVDAFERVLNAKTGSPYSNFYFAIKNSEAYFKGEIKDFSQVGVKVNSQGQVIIDLSHRLNYFRFLLAARQIFPIRKELIDKYGDKWTALGNLQTLGAFRLKTWNHDKSLVLERNDSYWGAKAKIKYILGYMITEYSTAVNLFQLGKLDFQDTVPYSEIPRLSKTQGFHQFPVIGVYYYGFNVRKPPMNDKRVRQAIAHAIDRREIAALLNGGMVPSSGLEPPGMIGYNPKAGLQFDLELANRLLDDAGFKDRKSFPKIAIGINTSENHQRIAENIQFQLKKNLHIDVDLNNQEWKVYLASLKHDPPSIYRMGWISSSPEPQDIFLSWTSKSENNFSGWKNQAFDELYAQATQQLNIERKISYYAKAQKVLIEDDVPVLPLLSYVFSVLISPRVVDFPINALDLLEFKDASLQLSKP